MSGYGDLRDPKERFSDRVDDYVRFRGRLMSSSYAPRAGDPSHEPMLRRLAEIFATHAREGLVTFSYQTVVWHGRLG